MRTPASLVLALSLLTGCGATARTTSGPALATAAAVRLEVSERNLQGAWVLERYSEGRTDRTRRAIRDNGGSAPTWTLASGGRLETDQGEGAWWLDGRELHLSLPGGAEQMLLVEGLSADALQLFTPSYLYPYSTFARR